jgi:hypothetical protein
MAARKNTSKAPDQDALVTALVAALRDAGVQPAPATPTDVAEVTAKAQAPKAEGFDAKTHAEGEGYALNTGRTYLTGDALKAAARVAKSGTPEIVATSGGRNSHVLLFRSPAGDVAVQNLRKA